jgi:hypothetical protein
VTVLDGCSEIVPSLNMHVVKWEVSGETVTFIGDMELGIITMCSEQCCHLRGRCLRRLGFWILSVTPGFRREVAENCAPLGC